MLNIDPKQKRDILVSLFPGQKEEVDTKVKAMKSDEEQLKSSNVSAAQKGLPVLTTIAVLVAMFLPRINV